MMSTTERLAIALEQAGAPKAMITAARAGCYDDFKSESASPITDLVRDLHQAAREAPGQPLNRHVSPEQYDAQDVCPSNLITIHQNHVFCDLGFGHEGRLHRGYDEATKGDITWEGRS